MNKFIVIWDVGYGDNHEVVEAEDAEAANLMAYESWRQDAEDNANYSAVPYSKDLADDFGLD